MEFIDVFLFILNTYYMLVCFAQVVQKQTLGEVKKLKHIQ